MGSYKLKYFQSLHVFLFTFGIFIHALAEDKKSNNLADAFISTGENSTNTELSKEVEPIVVGREKWNSPPPSSSDLPIGVKESKNIKASKIDELDPLETEQGKNIQPGMPVKPPAIPPAVNIHRNFEGKLVLKPRKFGFERDYPYQLQNSRGKTLAFVDFNNLKSVDPLTFKNEKVNILGKLEPVDENSKKLVIRARILRKVD